MGKYAVIFCDFKVRCSLQTVQTFHYVKQNITGNSWEDMFSSFKRMVSNLYKEWYQYLEHILDPEEKAFFESIRLNTASEGDWRDGLQRLSVFLARKSERGAMVFIDEYEVPNNRAYDHG